MKNTSMLWNLRNCRNVTLKLKGEIQLASRVGPCFLLVQWTILKKLGGTKGWRMLPSLAKTEMFGGIRGEKGGFCNVKRKRILFHAYLEHCMTQNVSLHPVVFLNHFAYQGFS